MLYHIGKYEFNDLQTMSWWKREENLCHQTKEWNQEVCRSVSTLKTDMIEWDDNDVHKYDDVHKNDDVHKYDDVHKN